MNIDLYNPVNDIVYNEVSDIISAPMEDTAKALDGNIQKKLDMYELILEKPHVLGHMIGFTRLQELHSKWIKGMWYGLEPSEDRAMQAHRGSYKTSAVTQTGILLQLIKEPTARIALVRYNVTDSVAVAGTVRNAFRLPAIKALLEGEPFNYDLNETSQKEDRLRWGFMGFNPKKEGNLDSWGITGSLTGWHYDYIVICDAVTIEDRLSPARRERVKIGVRELRSNIKDPLSHVLMEGTPWHIRDAWEAFKPNFKYSCYDTNLLTEEQIKGKQAILTKIEFGCNYELEHLNSADQIFINPKFDKWEYCKNKSFMQIDAKYDGDHAWGLTLGQKRRDGTWQIKGFVGYDHIDNHTDWIIELCVTHNVRMCVAEKNADKGYFIKELKKASKGISTCRTTFKNYQETQNKHSKIQSYGKKFYRDVVFCDLMQENANYNDENRNGFGYMQMLIDYIDGEPLNDAPDSFATFAREFYSTKKARSNTW